MFVITEWIERYEVNDKGQPARSGDKLRVRPLEYVRSKVHGRSQGAGFARLQEVAGHRCYEVFGIFQKFLEIAGCDKGGKRGKLLNEKGDPATIADLAFLLRTSENKVEYSLQVLTDKRVGWLQDDSVPEIPEIPGNSGVFKNVTKRNVTKRNITKHSVCFNYENRNLTGLTDQDYIDWSEAFPAVNVRREVKSARQWLIDNPKKRKKQIRRFLTNWLRRCQESGGNQGKQNESVLDQVLRLKAEGELS